MDNLEFFGEFGKQIKTEIDEAVKNHIAALANPLAVLTAYENVDVLLIDDLCRIFHRGTDSAGREWIREAAKRGDIPHIKIGREIFFPKNLIAKLLIGEWQCAERDRIKSPSGKSFKGLSDFLS